MKQIKTLVLVLTIAFALAACANTETPTNTGADNSATTPETAAATATPEVLDDVAEGKKHYVEQCVKCHKETGKGGPVEIEGKKIKPDDLTTAKMIKEPDSEYIEYITDGIPDEGMPSFKKILTEEQIKQVIKYIRADLQK